MKLEDRIGEKKKKEQSRNAEPDDDVEFLFLSDDKRRKDQGENVDEEEHEHFQQGLPEAVANIHIIGIWVRIPQKGDDDEEIEEKDQ